MTPPLIEKPFRKFVNDISDQYFALTGPVIAAMAVHAAALGEACMQISLDNQIDKLEWQDITARIGQMAHIKNALLEWCNRDLSTILALDNQQRHSEDEQLKLLDYAAEVGHLSAQAVQILMDFRPFAFDRVQDDLEITISLLINLAQASMQLLDSFLKQSPADAIRQTYAPIQTQLEMQVKKLLESRE